MFTMDDLGVKVTFSHARHEGRRYRGATICHVIDLNNGASTGGVSYCSIDDNFCYETGRKLALARALEDFDRATRKRIWERYFETRGKVVPQ